MENSYIKKVVVELPEYNAGLSDEYVQKHYNPERIIRLASNENPLGVSPLAKMAATDAAGNLWKYSDPDTFFLREALASKTGINTKRIIIGNGSEDLIHLLCRACLSVGEKVVTVEPSFLLHEIYPKEQGAVVQCVPMDKELRFDVKGIVDAIKGGCKMLIFSNPSNPVGSMMTGDELDVILRALPENCIVVMDEAYYEYASVHEDYPESIEQLDRCTNPYVILRTFSKAFGLAGARVGYGLFSEEWFATQINKLRNPFNVNSIAQAAALAALDDEDHLLKTVQHNSKVGEKLSSRLRQSGFFVPASLANFLFIDCGLKTSALVAGDLLRKGIIVKPWGAIGYEQFLRVTVGKTEDAEIFFHAFVAAVASQSAPL